jgi:hypothetical protein
MQFFVAGGIEASINKGALLMSEKLAPAAPTAPCEQTETHIVRRRSGRIARMSMVSLIWFAPRTG